METIAIGFEHSQYLLNRFLLEKFPATIEDRDNEGRTPLHYASALLGTTGGVNSLYGILVEAGADENVVDIVSFFWLEV